jgi:hypothetical protein
MVVPVVPIELGDVVRLKKPHACGDNAWEVTRVGADIRLKCTRCARSVMLARSEFDRAFRGYVSRARERGEDAAGTSSQSD